MLLMEKILLLLLAVGTFWSVGSSARGLEPAQDGQAVQAAQATQAAQQAQAGDPNRGFTLQSGYEGYLLSPQKAGNAVSAWSELLTVLAKSGFLKSSRSLLVPFSTFVLLYGFKIFKWLIRIFGLVAIGTLLAIPLCTFTSFCSISLASSPFSFIKANAVKEQVTEFARTYMSAEKLEMVTRLVQSALETYGSSNSDKLKDQPSTPATAHLPQLPSKPEPDQQQNEAHVD